MSQADTKLNQNAGEPTKIEWVTGSDLREHPTPAEICAIALAITANLGSSLTLNVAPGITLRGQDSEALRIESSEVGQR